MRIFFALFLLGCAAVQADERSISINGRSAITVTTATIHLGDVAEVLSKTSTDDDAVIGLQKLFIGTSPQPGAQLTLSAAEILGKLREQGVNLNKVIYTLPRIMTIQRAGREVQPRELEGIISQFLQKKSRDVSVKQIVFDKPVTVDPSTTTYEVTGEGRRENGKHFFSIATTAKDEPSQSFEVAALLEEFKDLPIANRPIAKGAVINAEDIGRARFNIAMLPRDFTENEQSIVGLAANNDIGSGEVFRSSKLALPIAIRSGEKVIMRYQSGLLEVTASGIAAGEGALGQEIKVRNENSKKIIVGEIIEPGLVRVK